VIGDKLDEAQIKVRASRPTLGVVSDDGPELSA